MIFDQYYQSLNNVPLIFKQHIHAVYIFENDSVIIYNTENISVANNLKKIYLIATILNAFTSTYYDDKHDSFE